MGQDAIILAHCAPFQLGPLRIDPSRRQVANGARSTTLEPRVLEVLIALFQARGAVLSRDDLIAAAWRGNVVGDNAIQRAVSRVRQLADGLGEGAFTVETVRGVGYRLALGADDPEAGSLHDLPSRRPNRRVALAAIGGAAAAVALLSARLLRNPTLNGEAGDLFERAETARRDQDGQSSPQQSVALYRAALDLEPTYAPAWAGLALAYCQQLDNERDERTENIGRLALSAAERARQLDPETVLGRAAAMMAVPAFGNWRAARAQLSDLGRQRRTWEIPVQLAHLSSNMGDIREAIRFNRIALNREALNVHAHGDLFYGHWISGNIHAAEKLLDDGARRWPRSYYLWSTRYLYLLTTGRIGDALAFLRQGDHQPLNLGPKAISSREALAEVLRGNGRERPALRDHFIVNAKMSNWSTRNSAIMLAILDEREPVLAMLDGFYRGVGPFARRMTKFSRRPTDWLFTPFFDRFRNDSRFVSRLRSFGLDPQPKI